MSVLRDLWEQRSRAPVTSDGYPSVPDSGGAWAQGMTWVPGSGSRSVSTEEAMLSSAVFACLRLLSEGVATLPLDTYELNAAGHRVVFTDRPRYLNFDPPQMSRIDYLSQVMLSLLTAGDAFILTPRDKGTGEPLQLIPVNPDTVKVAWSRDKTTLEYRINGNMVDPAGMMHITGMRLPGSLTGCSPIRYARETIGLDRDARRFGSSFFSNGALPGAVIEAPGEMSQKAADRMRDTWNASHAGVGNGNRLGVLTEGAKLNKVSIAPDDAQFLQTRQFQVPDIARIYGVPPHLIADASNSTSWGSGLAEQNLAFGQFSLRPWTERIEDAHTRLLTSHGMKPVFVKLNIDALLRASLADRYAAGAVGILNGFLTINEVRAHEDLPPVTWGDVPYVPLKATLHDPPADEVTGPLVPPPVAP